MLLLNYKVPTRFLLLCNIVISTLLLQACGLSDERGGTTGATGSVNNNTDTSETASASLDKTIGITAESLNGDIDTASPGTITIVSLNEDFQEISDGNIPDFNVKRADSSGYELQVSSNYVEQLNHVLKVRFSQDEFLYAPIPILPNQLSIVRKIAVNIRSHYVVKKLFDVIETEEELNKLLPCAVSGSNNDCENQARAKSDLLSLISNSAAEYANTIASSLSVDESLASLDTQIAFKNHIETAINEITRDPSPLAKGTRRDSTSLGFDSDSITLTTPPPWATEYNSVFFSLSLNEIESEGVVNVAASNSVIVGENELNNTLPVYPSFSHTVALTDLRRDQMAVNIPFSRTALTFKDNNTFDFDAKEPINAFESSRIDSFLSTESFLLDARTMEHLIPSDTIGWQLDPMFSKVYRANEYEPDSVFSLDIDNTEDTETENILTLDPNADIDFGGSPTWLTSANYSTGATYNVINSTTPRSLGEKLEDINLFSWEIHSLETDADFSISDVNEKRYGVISYALRMNEKENPVMELFGETLQWDITSNSTIAVSQPSSHYKSYTLERSKDNTVNPVTEKSDIFQESRSIFTKETIEVLVGSPDRQATNQGIVMLDGGSEPPQGHSTQNGNYLAFVFDTTDFADSTERGKGIIIASALDSDFVPVFPSESSEPFVYQLQGNSLAMENDSNTLKNYNGSTLSISADATDGCKATLSLRNTYVEHTISTSNNTISAPQEKTFASSESNSCELNGSLLELNFEIHDTSTEILTSEPPTSETLNLKGFITRSKGTTDQTTPGNLITFLWMQNDNLGLILAHKEQDLDTAFPKIN